MAVTTESLELAEAHRLSQVNLRATTASELAEILPLLNFEDLKGTWPAIERLIIQMIKSRRSESQQIAQEFYAAVRAAEGAAGAFTPVAADALDLGKLVRNLRIAGPGHAGSALYRGAGDVYGSTLSNLEGEVSRNILNGGRGATLNSVHADRVAVGYVRITDGNPCAFCAMLASRGPVYKSARSAVTGPVLVNGEYKAHPRCGCTAKPVYAKADPWPERNQQFREQWDATTKGYSGNDALNAFRRALAAAA